MELQRFQFFLEGFVIDSETSDLTAEHAYDVFCIAHRKLVLKGNSFAFTVSNLHILMQLLYPVWFEFSGFNDVFRLIVLRHWSPLSLTNHHPVDYDVLTSTGSYLEIDCESSDSFRIVGRSSSTSRCA